MPDDMVECVARAIATDLINAPEMSIHYFTAAKAAIAATDREELVALLEESAEMLDDIADQCLEETPFAAAQVRSMVKRVRAALKGTGNG